TVINHGSNGQPTVNMLNNGDSVAQYWVTPDGLRVTGTAGRVYSHLEQATGDEHISYADSNVNTGLITKFGD
ncbi:MAG: hypothetical protein II072_02030, partial [Clostridia bacterium]|nr:hypothetical protein [Clostridia bacterium]